MLDFVVTGVGSTLNLLTSRDSLAGLENILSFLRFGGISSCLTDLGGILISLEGILSVWTYLESV